MRRLAALGALPLFASSALFVGAQIARASAPVSVAHPSAGLVDPPLDYAAALTHTDGSVAALPPISAAVVGASLADNSDLQYERASDLGGFEPAPVGQYLVTTTGRTASASARRAQIPLLGNTGTDAAISSFGLVPGGGVTSTGASSGGGGSGASAGAGVAGGVVGGGGSSSGGSTSIGGGSTTVGGGGVTTSGGAATAAGGSSANNGTARSSAGGTTVSSGSSTTTATTPVGSITSTSTPGPNGVTPTTTARSTTTTIAKGSPTTTTVAVTSTTTPPPEQSIGMTNDHNANALITVTNMAPGETASELVTIGNDGTVPFELYVEGTLSGQPNALSDALTLSITRVSDGLLIYRGALSTSAPATVEPMAVNESTQFRVDLSLSSAAGNGLQNETARMDLVWTGQG